MRRLMRFFRAVQIKTITGKKSRDRSECRAGSDDWAASNRAATKTVPLATARTGLAGAHAATTGHLANL